MLRLGDYSRDLRPANWGSESSLHGSNHEPLMSALGQKQTSQHTFSSRPGGLTLAEAYRVTALLRAAFEARGEKITGRKIGFTNREIWKVYGVQSPVWGYATNCTTYELALTKVMHVKDFTEPCIEPEIMFGLKAPPLPGINEADCAGL